MILTWIVIKSGQECYNKLAVEIISGLRLFNVENVQPVTSTMLYISTSRMLYNQWWPQS